MAWFISDPHFFHNNVINICKRPFGSITEMHQAMIHNWNSRIKPKDHVYIVGDFSFGGIEATKKIVSQLNGYKIFIKGNHDKKAKKLFELGFDEVLENEKIRVGNHEVLVSHFPYHPVSDYKVENGLVVAKDVSYKNDRKYLHKRILDDGETWLIHGHVHTAWKQKGRMINVGVDVWDFKPVHHEKIVQMIESGPQDIDVKKPEEYDEAD